MGMMLGKISVETPKWEVLQSYPDEYEIRVYPPYVVAQVTYDHSSSDRDAGFMILANYIGALGNPQNHRPEKIAMTAPVITTTRPAAAGAAGEKIAMTAPVVTTTTADDQTTMQFVLPNSYRKAEDAPRPVDERVEIREVGESKYAVVRFSGVATDKVVEEKVRLLEQWVERDGHRRMTMLPFLLARYNPPWTIPAFRTNEVMLPLF